MEIKKNKKRSEITVSSVKPPAETTAALLNLLEDIEEARRKAEEEKNKTRATLLSLVDGLVVFDKEKKISLVNPEAERILDFKEGEVLGKKIEELYKFPNLLQLYQVLGKKLEWTGQRYELVLEKPLKRFFQVKIVPVTSSDEEKGLMVILHDITRDKEIERLKSEFVSIAAHQLRTPLSAVKWTLRMLLDGDLGNLSVKQTEFLEKGYESNEKMIVLVNDLLNVARIEEGRFRYEYSFCFIDKLIEKAINQIKEQAKERDVEIIFEKPKQSLPEMKVDCRSIELALQNLVSNAVVYNKPGGLVKILVSYDKMEVKVEITDTGIGISSAEKDRIFTKFFRATNAIKSDTEGSGLGLFICKNIIESHGGKIWFKSEENKGTSFFFTLPVEKKFEEFLRKF